MTSIKAIIADVDGVMVGEQTGVNFPLPHKDVIKVLKRVSAAGIPIVLCTGKFNFAIKEIIRQANLDNPHITDGGALIINSSKNAVIKKHTINKQTVKEFTSACLAENIYLELYTPESYYVQAAQPRDFTLKRTELLQMEPTIVPSLMSLAGHEDIIKIMCFTDRKEGSGKVDTIIKRLGKRVNFIWSSHPYLEPIRPGIITAPGVSKAQAVKEVAQIINTPFTKILGIGDNKSDWNFMALCRYAGTVGNESKELKRLVKTKGEGNYFIAPSVDDHGFLEILDHFQVN